MEFVVGCDLEEFKRYCRRLALDEEWRNTNGWTGEFGGGWERRLAENPSLLIVWRLGGEVVCHAIWHESNTD